MPEHNAVFLAYSHLRDFPRADDALQTLRRVASLVKPLMRARRWKVRELAEFYPEQANLLGLNINRGQKILLRLRYPGDPSLFLPLEQVADTLLHELAHIVHGPHDAVFQALWDQLRDEHMALTLKGFTGESFLSEGRRLGGGNDVSMSGWAGPPSPNHLRRPIPMEEARRLAKQAAERRQAKAAAAERAERERARRSSTGHRLGGSSSGAAGESPSDLRRVVADAVARRNSHTPETMRGCATDGPQYNDMTRAWLADQASRNGFRTQAEEDAANDAAIAQALWELVQEDEKARLGDRYVPPTAERPEGGGGLLSVSAGNNQTRNRRGSSSSPIIIDDSPRHHRPAPPPPPPPARVRRSSISAPPPGTATRHPAPVSPGPAPNSNSHGYSSHRPSSGSSSFSSSRGWTCNICTLHNPSTYLVCDACGVEKPSSPKDKDKSRSSSSSAHSHRHSHSSSHSSIQPQQQPVLVPIMGGPPQHHNHPPPPPPRRSHAASNAAAAASSRASSQQTQQQPKKPKVKKTVRFTPSTRGGSISSTTSTSIRARARSGSPPPSLSSRANIIPVAGPSSSVVSSHSGGSSNGASSTWMCTACWKNMGRKYSTCDSCGKPQEAWQQRM
ncbi:hypothetical protein SEUCBS140593_010238 [Sporothrix eucalyptigena]|uniref:Zinc metallopeptidase n=1 Tax=Sporothrix eucalyptigena TaxID=1812306 RepID=A0ABP0D0P8_9PEZI